jgi:hypothetical protein
MKRTLVRGTLLVTFAIAVGHLMWVALLGPPQVPKYLVGGNMPALVGSNPAAKQLYLRREVYLTQRPLHAWLQVLSHDRVTLYVNGQLLVDKTAAGFDAAIVTDPSPYLQVGRNIIAILARQESVNKPVVVGVEGAYVLSDGEHPLCADNEWRCHDVFDRTGYWWFETAFEDRHWADARLTTCYLRGVVGRPPSVTTALLGQQAYSMLGAPSVEGPPAATRTPCRATRIKPALLVGESTTVRREFDLADRPREAWLRVTASSSYRLAINGILLDQQESQLDSAVPSPPMRRTYDITCAVQRGRNVVTLGLTGIAGPPSVLADLGVREWSGQTTYLGTDEKWMSCPGLPADWLAVTPVDPSDWRPCVAESPNLGGMPWEPRRLALEIALPLPILLWRALQQVGVILAVAVAAFLVCRVAARLLERTGGAGAASMVYLALLPATLGIATAVLATYDPRIDRASVYQGVWVVVAVASVLLQWGLLALLAFLSGAKGERQEQAGLSVAVWLPAALVVLLLAVGFWLRFRDLVTEPLQHDESNHYRMSHGFLKRGFPSFEIHPNLPPKFVETSTLFYVSTAMTALVFEEPRWVVRTPALFWGTATILLMFVVGRHLFDPVVGLVAATLYTFAALCIQMAHFGRYLSQTQFLALLTIYLYWRTIQGTGPINRRMLWLTALAFLCTYLSWEATALMAPGMILALLLHRRGSLRVVLGDMTVWLALVIVAMVVIVQYSFRELSLSRFLWYGAGGARDTKLTPMWGLPDFELWYYVWNASWSRDTFLPMLGLLGSMLLAVRHRYREPIRMLLVPFLCTGLFMALFMSVKQWRYAYHLGGFLILLFSVTLVVAVRWLTTVAASIQVPLWRWYAGAVAALAILVPVALGSGMTTQLADMVEYRIPPYLEPLGLESLKFANHEGALKFLRERIQEGDVVMANRPHLVDVIWGGRRADYFPENLPLVPAVLDDRRPIPLHYYNGAPLVHTRKAMDDLFARHHRVWYVSAPDFHTYTNDAEMSDYLAQHMDVVYEDFLMVVLFRGPNHRTASMRSANVSSLGKARSTLWDYRSRE